MLKKIAFVFGVFFLGMVVYSSLTDREPQSCCQAATIPCIKMANQNIVNGHEKREQLGMAIECLTTQLRYKESELEILSEQPASHTYRIKLTQASTIYLREVINNKLAEIDGGQVYQP